MMQTGRPLCLVVRSWISHGLSDHSLTIWSRCFSEERKQDSRRWARIFIDDIKRSSMSLVKACELGLSHRDHKWDAWLILWGKSFRIWLNMSVTSIVKHFLTLHPRCECSWFYTIVWCREASFCRTGVLIGSWWRMLRDLGSCHWGKDTVLPVSDIRKWLGGWVVHKDIHEIWMTQWPILKWVYHGLSWFIYVFSLLYIRLQVSEISTRSEKASLRLLVPSPCTSQPGPSISEATEAVAEDVTCEVLCTITGCCHFSLHTCLTWADILCQNLILNTSCNLIKWL